jgi:hypothetical protein
MRYTVVVNTEYGAIEDTFDADDYKVDSVNNLMFYKRGHISPIVMINHKYWQVVQEARSDAV